MSYDPELSFYEPKTPEKPMWMTQQESNQGNNRHRRWTREDNIAKKKRVAKRRAKK